MTEHAIMDVDEKFMTDSMKEALEKHQFQVYYQPKYDMKTEKVAGAEALVRWMHPEKGMISPRQFIPIFEKNGFITELDSYVWETVCQDMNKWKQQGYPAAAVSVNLSRKDLCNPRLLIILSDLLEKYKIPANYLHLEITENAYTDDYEKMIETVCELRKLGFMIEMDDFGSGSASLNMLAELPIDVLKLDMDFIQTETARASGKGILGFVISLAKWLNLSGVAEGVETPEQLTILQSMGCNFVQGYYYEKPMPEKEFAKILSTSAISEISFSTNQGTIEDILMKRVAEDSLMQEKYRFVLDNLDVAFFEYDETGNFYSSDKYTQYVVSRESISNIMNNDGAYEGVHPDDIPILFEFFKQKERHQKKVAVTLRLKMVDGTYRWTEMMGFFDYDMNGKRIKSMGVLRDVDREWQQQNRKLQDALKVAEKANQAKTDFLSRVSHDMRTPLNGILGLTYLISRKVKDESIQQELQQLEQSGKYLLNLVDDTLDVSSIESGKMELHPQVCDGRTAFETVISMVMPSIEAKGIHLKMKAENLPFTKLYIDVGRAQQAVMNILSNAIKFTPDGGTIEFSMENLSQENGLITDRIVIRDNGIGMSEAFMKNLFQPFAQEHNGSKSIYQDPSLLFSAHYDAVPGSTGANDNTASVCILIELALEFTRQGIPARFAFFDGEENKLAGSKFYVNQIDRSLITGAINLDLCGFGDAMTIYSHGKKPGSIMALEPFMRKELLELYHGQLVSYLPKSDDYSLSSAKIPALGISVMPRTDVAFLKALATYDNGILGKPPEYAMMIDQMEISTTMHGGYRDDPKWLDDETMDFVYQYLLKAASTKPEKVKKRFGLF